MKFLVHIGYPKAASTFLQSTLFSGKHPDIKPLLLNGYSPNSYNKSGHDVFFNKDRENINHINPLYFDSELARENIYSRIDETAKITCLSNEAWAGHPYSGGITSKIFLERIHQTLPEAKILIIVRNQESMIFSSYVQYLVRSRGFGDIKNFLNNKKQIQIPFHNLSYYQYHNLAEHYTRLFGRKNVLILPFEMLKSEKKIFTDEICNFSNATLEYEFKFENKNVAQYKEYVILKKLPILNLLDRGSPIHGFKPPKSLNIRSKILNILKRFTSNKITEKNIESDLREIRNHLDERFINSNRKLQTYTNINLEPYGYKI